MKNRQAQLEKWLKREKVEDEAGKVAWSQKEDTINSWSTNDGVDMGSLKLFFSSGVQDESKKTPPVREWDKQGLNYSCSSGNKLNIDTKCIGKENWNNFITNEKRGIQNYSEVQQS